MMCDFCGMSEEDCRASVDVYWVPCCKICSHGCEPPDDW